MKTSLCVMTVTTILTGCVSTSATEHYTSVNADGSINIRFSGGDGSSIKNAVILIGATNEMAGVGGETLWAQQFLPGWQKTNQELIANGRKSYDGITYKSPDGKTRTIYFDISNFFGKF